MINSLVCQKGVTVKPMCDICNLYMFIISVAQRCADPEIFESASVCTFWPRICCQSTSATKKILDLRQSASAL